MATGTDELLRLRSFIERYVVARATQFRVGHETEDAHNVIMDARSIYGRIADVSLAEIEFRRRREEALATPGRSDVEKEKLYKDLQEYMQVHARNLVPTSKLGDAYYCGVKVEEILKWKPKSK